jgi:hypothetical protein
MTRVKRPGLYGIPFGKVPLVKRTREACALADMLSESSRLFDKSGQNIASS